MKPWTLKRALELIRTIEPLLAASGWHVALAGSVLLRGRSQHDLDLAVFPHSTARVDVRAMRRVLRAAGWLQIRTVAQVHSYWRQTRKSNDRKHVEVWMTDGRRVDVIYPVAVDS